MKLFVLVTALSLTPATVIAQSNATASFAISGAEYLALDGTWPSGTAYFAINHEFYAITYGQYSTPQSIASTIAGNVANYCGSLFKAYAVGNIIYFRPKTNGQAITFLSISNSPVFLGNSSIAPSTPLAPPPDNDPSCCYQALPD